jgi:Ca2+-binding RTX toxin-like protein
VSTVAASTTRIMVDGGAGSDGLKILGTPGVDRIAVGRFGSFNTTTVKYYNTAIYPPLPPTLSLQATIPQRFKLANAEILQIFGEAGNDILVNNSDAPSMIDGGQGNDLIYGHDAPSAPPGSRDDVLLGGANVDQLFGRGGNDYLFADYQPVRVLPPQQKEVLDGGAGSDTGVCWAAKTFLFSVETQFQQGGYLTVWDWLHARFPKLTAANVDVLLTQLMGLDWMKPFPVCPP